MKELSRKIFNNPNLDKKEYIQQIEKHLNDKIDIMEQKIEILSSREHSSEAAHTLNKYISLYDAPLMALILEAKATSPSRTARNKKNPIDDYQPFIIESDDTNSVTLLANTLQKMKTRGQKGRFDFLFFDETLAHIIPVEITCDGKDINIFIMDAGVRGELYEKDNPLANHTLDKLYELGKLYYYRHGNVQNTQYDCGTFALQSLNAMNNMSIAEKKASLTSKNFNNELLPLAALDPRLLKNTQSLSKLSQTQKEAIITKQGSPTKRLSESLSIYEVSVEEEKGLALTTQNRRADEITLKYLKAAKNKLDELKNNGGEDLIIETIYHRLNRYNKLVSLPSINTQQQNLEQLKEKILIFAEKGQGFAIGELIRSFPEHERLQLLDAAITSANLLVNTSQIDNVGGNIRDIIEAFPEELRSHFIEATKNAINKCADPNFQATPSKSIIDLLESFPQEQRIHFINNIKYVMDQVCLNENSAHRNSLYQDFSKILKLLPNEEKNNFIDQLINSFNSYCIDLVCQNKGAIDPITKQNFYNFLHHIAEEMPESLHHLPDHFNTIMSKILEMPQAEESYRALVCMTANMIYAYKTDEQQQNKLLDIAQRVADIVLTKENYYLCELITDFSPKNQLLFTDKILTQLNTTVEQMKTATEKWYGNHLIERVLEHVKQPDFKLIYGLLAASNALEQKGYNCSNSQKILQNKLEILTQEHSSAHQANNPPPITNSRYKDQKSAQL